MTWLRRSFMSSARRQLHRTAARNLNSTSSNRFTSYRISSSTICDHSFTFTTTKTPFSSIHLHLKPAYFFSSRTCFKIPELFIHQIRVFHVSSTVHAFSASSLTSSSSSSTPSNSSSITPSRHAKSPDSSKHPTGIRRPDPSIYEKIQEFNRCVRSKELDDACSMFFACSSPATETTTTTTTKATSTISSSSPVDYTTTEPILRHHGEHFKNNSHDPSNLVDFLSISTIIMFAHRVRIFKKDPALSLRIFQKLRDHGRENEFNIVAVNEELMALSTLGDLDTIVQKLKPMILTMKNYNHNLKQQKLHAVVKDTQILSESDNGNLYAVVKETQIRTEQDDGTDVSNSSQSTSSQPFHVANSSTCTDHFHFVPPCPDERTFLAAIHCAFNLKKHRKAFTFLKIMEDLQLNPSSKIYDRVIHTCIEANDLDAAWNVIKLARIKGTFPSEYTYSKLIHHYSTQNQIDKAWAIFYEYMSEKNVSHGIITFNAMLAACVQNKQITKAMSVLTDMQLRFVSPNTDSFAHIIRGLLNARNLDADRERACGLVEGLYLASQEQLQEHSASASASATNCYGSDSISDFEPSPNSKPQVDREHLLYRLILGLSVNGGTKMAIRLVRRLLKVGHTIPHDVFNILMDNIFEFKSLYFANMRVRKQLASSIMRDVSEFYDQINFIPFPVRHSDFYNYVEFIDSRDGYTDQSPSNFYPKKHLQNRKEDFLRHLGHQMMKGICRRGLHQAPLPTLSVFRYLKKLDVELSSESYTYLIQAYATAHDPEQAETILKLMIASKLTPTIVDYQHVITAYATNGALDDVRRLLDQLYFQGLEPNQAINLRVMEAIIRADRLSTLYDFIDEVVDSSLSSTMLRHCLFVLIRKDYIDEAWRVFLQYGNHDNRNVKVYNTLLKAFGFRNNIRKVKILTDMMEQDDVKLDLDTINNVAMTYAGIGDINGAVNIVNRAPELYRLFPDSGTRAYLIKGLCAGGLFDAALFTVYAGRGSLSSYFPDPSPEQVLSTLQFPGEKLFKFPTQVRKDKGRRAWKTLITSCLLYAENCKYSKFSTHPKKRFDESLPETSQISETSDLPDTPQDNPSSRPTRLAAVRAAVIAWRNFQEFSGNVPADLTARVVVAAYSVDLKEVAEELRTKLVLKKSKNVLERYNLKTTFGVG